MKLATTVLDPVLRMIRSWIRQHPLVLYGGLTLAVIAIGCGLYGRIPGTDRFHVPVEYHGNALFTTAMMVDPGVGANLFLLLGFVTNTLAYCWAARRLGSSPLRAGAGAIMFAFSTYALWRGLAHSLLVYEIAGNADHDMVAYRLM
jgi:hypothetical protein